MINILIISKLYFSGQAEVLNRNPLLMDLGPLAHTIILHLGKVGSAKENSVFDRQPR